MLGEGESDTAGGLLLVEAGACETGAVTGSMGHEGSIALMRESIVDNILAGNKVFHVVLSL